MPSRRRVLAGVGGAAATALAGCLDSPNFSPGSDADADWPMERYDAANTAFAPDAAAPRTGVRERWTFEAGGASGAPVVVDGTVYQPTMSALVALDSETGETQVVAGGWPLYYFASDEQPGDAKGQGANDVWWVLRPDGSVVRPDSAAGDY